MMQMIPQGPGPPARRARAPAPGPWPPAWVPRIKPGRRPEAISRRPRRRRPVLRCRAGAAGDELQVVFVSTEVAHWSKVGGLADFASALPEAMARRGHRVMTVVPRYRAYEDTYDTGLTIPIELGIESGARLQALVGQPYVKLYMCNTKGVDRVFLDHPLFRRQHIYSYQSGYANPDLDIMYSVLCQSALVAPVVLWQSGLPQLTEAPSNPMQGIPVSSVRRGVVTRSPLFNSNHNPSSSNLSLDWLQAEEEQQAVAPESTATAPGVVSTSGDEGAPCLAPTDAATEAEDHDRETQMPSDADTAAQVPPLPETTTVNERPDAGSRHISGSSCPDGPTTSQPAEAGGDELRSFPLQLGVSDEDDDPAGNDGLSSHRDNQPEPRGPHWPPRQSDRSQRQPHDSGDSVGIDDGDDGDGPTLSGRPATRTSASRQPQAGADSRVQQLRGDDLSRRLPTAKRPSGAGSRSHSSSKELIFVANDWPTASLALWLKHYYSDSGADSSGVEIHEEEPAEEDERLMTSYFTDQEAQEEATPDQLARSHRRGPNRLRKVWRMARTTAGNMRRFVSRQLRGAKVAFCLHNGLHHGLYDIKDFKRTGLPASALQDIRGSPLDRTRMETEGGPIPDSVTQDKSAQLLNWLVTGILQSDMVLTVSPSYAEELEEGKDSLQPGDAIEEAGGIRGILNGIDVELWNPKADPFLPASVRYDASTAVAGKAAAKKMLQQRLGLAIDSRAPLVGFVGRLHLHKGVDIILSAVPEIMARPDGSYPLVDEFMTDHQGDPQMVMLGCGDQWMERSLEGLHLSYPGRAVGSPEFDESLAHLIFAASDFLLVPSRAEPCGLVALAALRYGALPIVSPVGGLQDIVSPQVNGFYIREQYVEEEAIVHPHRVDVVNLTAAVQSALSDFGTQKHEEMMETAMLTDVSWRSSALDWELALGELLDQSREQKAGGDVGVGSREGEEDAAGAQQQHPDDDNEDASEDDSSLSTSKPVVYQTCTQSMDE